MINKLIFSLLLMLLGFTNIYAFKNYDILIEELRKETNLEKKSILCNSISEGLQSQAPIIALDYAQRALKFAETSGDKSLKAKSLLNMASAFYYKGDEVQSYDHLERAREVFEQLQDTAMLGKVFAYISVIYETQQNYEKQFAYLNRALLYTIKANDSVQLAMVYSNGLGNSHLKLGQYEKALGYHLKALAIRQKLKDSLGLAFSYTFLGKLYSKLKDYPKAVEFFRLSLLTCDEIGDQVRKAETYLAMGEMEEANGNVQGALKATQNGLEICNKYHIAAIGRQSHQRLKELYLFTKNYERAYYHLNLQHQLNDFLEETQANQKLLVLQQVYENKQKEREFELKQEKVNRRNLMEYSFVLLFCIFLFFLVYVFLRFNISRRWLENIMVFSFLLFFEFILIVLDPLIGSYFDNEPIFVLIFNVVIAIGLVPLHRGLEDYIKSRWLKKAKEISNS